MTVYMAHDFTAITSGDLSTNDPDTDEVGSGWVVDPEQFDKGSGSFIEGPGSSYQYVTCVVTDGREDVRCTLDAIWHCQSKTTWSRRSGMTVRGRYSTQGGQLYVLTRYDSGPIIYIDLYDYSNSLLKTWDISAEYSGWTGYADRATVVIDCEGDDITLYSVDVDALLTVYDDDPYTLTGSAATNHGDASGADRYGLVAGAYASSDAFYEITVESIPVGGGPAGPHAGQRAISVV